jgi:aspartate/methionine/tyrosine aminotransferase
MAGWRVGMMLAKARHIENVLRFKSNMDSGMFLPVQLAAARALSLADDWYEEVNRIYRRRKQIVEEMLEGLGCNFSKKQAGLFVWAKVPDNISDGYAMSDLLLYKANVFITPGGIFGTAGNKYIRVSLCATEEKIRESFERLMLAGFIKPKQHV